jgi:hypothetical protein
MADNKMDSHISHVENSGSLSSTDEKRRASVTQLTANPEGEYVVPHLPVTDILLT